jgi:hypothetical protein
LNWLSLSPTQRLGKKLGRRATRHVNGRPRLEILEDRLAPATYTVNAITDTGAGSGLTGDLRYCINQANSTADVDTIVFDSTVFKTPQTITLGSTLPTVTDTGLTIKGPGAPLLTVSGNNQFNVFVFNASSVNLRGLTISEGLATSFLTGGGILNDGTLTVTNVTLSANSVQQGDHLSYAGGGIYNNHGTLTLNNSTLSGNTALDENGAGIFNAYGTLNLNNCTLSGNSATQGGGIFNIGGNATLTTSTLSGNTASNLGGGVDNFLYSTLTMNNTLVAGNTGSDPDIAAFAAIASTSSFNLIGDGAGVSGISDGSQGNQIGSNGNVINPLLAPLGNFGGPTQTMPLLPGSPALAAGGTSVSGLPTIDQRGFARQRNSTVDIGAFESRGFTVSVVAGSNQQAVVTTAFTNSLTAKTTSAFGEPIVGGAVRFTAPLSGAGATFPSAPATIAADHTAKGTATANTLAGNYLVSASVDPAGTATNFHLFNTPGAAAGFFVSAPLKATAGTAFSITVIAQDQYGNRPTSYLGTAHFTCSDPSAAVVLPADYAFLSTDKGQHTFTGVILALAGKQTIAATDTVQSGFTGTSAGTTVLGAAASSLTVTGFPSPIVAGTAGSFKVTAYDQFGNVATGYTGTIAFSTSSAKATLPPNYTFTAGNLGVHSFSAKIDIVGSQSLTATDTLTASITGSQTGIVVNPSTATHFSGSAFPASTVAGQAFSITFTARDAFNNTATGYLGTVHFTSSDVNANVVLPADYTFTAADAGVHTWSNGFTLIKAPTQTVSITDTVASSITGFVKLTVTGAAATSLKITGLAASVAHGTATTFIVTALDAFGNTAIGYRGQVRFIDTDASASALPKYAFTAADAGSHQFTVTFNTLGAQAIVAQDTSSSTITAGAAATLVTAITPEQMLFGDLSDPDDVRLLMDALETELTSDLVSDLAMHQVERLADDAEWIHSELTPPTPAAIALDAPAVAVAEQIAPAGGVQPALAAAAVFCGIFWRDRSAELMNTTRSPGRASSPRS